jgi:hypothetical protein
LMLVAISSSTSVHFKPVMALSLFQVSGSISFVRGALFPNCNKTLNGYLLIRGVQQPAALYSERRGLLLVYWVWLHVT